MRAMAKVKSTRATYREEKTLSILSQPLVAEGMLEYRAPDTLIKKVTSPLVESYEIRNRQLIITDSGGGQRVVFLDDFPLVRAFVESIRATLAGDAEGLRAHYQVGFSGKFERWVLTLEPRRAELAQHISRIIITGRGVQMRTIRTLETDGDFSVMTIRTLGE